jgi:hypothetical protein
MMKIITLLLILLLHKRIIMKKLLLICSIFLFGNLLTNAQVSKTNSTQGTVTSVPAAGAHIDRTFTFTAGDFGGCTSLTEVEISIQLVLGNGTPPTPGAYGVHEDLNVRLVSPAGTTVDLVQDRWGYWTGNPSQPHSFNGFSAVNATVNFDDDNSPNIATLNDWQAGNYAPHNSLSAFDGENGAGTWTLRISDGNSQFSAADYMHFVTSTLTVTCGSACTDPTIPTITATSNPICSGSSTTLNISGTLNDATQWHIYTGFCGVTQIGTTTGSTFVVSPTSTTSYYVRGEGGCVTPGTCGAITVNVNSLDDASFSYGASAYCVADSEPTPTITGLAGGTFSSTAGLAINASTGTMDVSASTPGTYTVTYTTSGTCPNSSAVSVTINALDDASFSYGASAYCVADSDPTPTITGLGGGTFSSTAGLAINASTGTMDVSASTPGTYTVTYTTSGTCANSSGVTVTINACLGAECSNAIALSPMAPCGDTQTVSGSTVGGTPSTEAFCGTSLGTGGANWYTFTGDGTSWTASTVSAGTNYDTKLWIYEGACGVLNCVTGNDDFTGVQSQVTFLTTLGTTYYVVVGGFSGNEGNYDLILSNVEAEAPVITCPGNQTETPTASCQFTLPDYTGLGTATDNCSANPTITQSPIAGTAVGLGNTTITLTADDGNGNTSTCTFDVIVNSSITGTLDSTICNGESVVYNGTTYSSATSLTGTEILTAANGCDSVITVTVTELPALTGSVAYTICANESVVVNGTTYDAATPNGTEVFTNVGPNMCDSTVTIALNVLPALTGVVNNTICNGDTVFVKGTAYHAGNPTGTEVFSGVMQSGLYCDSTVTVALNVLPALTGTDNTTICATDSVIINGTTYNAGNPTGTEVFTNVGPNNCDSTVTVALNVETAIDVTIDNTLMPTLTANQTGATYQWVDCDNGNAPIATETGQSFTATANGNYAVEITIGSCTELSACEAVTGVGINEVTSSVVSIYPNPTSGMFTISLANTKGAISYTLTTLEGRIVEQANNVTQHNIQVDLTNESKGVYFLIIQENNTNTTYKIVRQ